MDLDLDGASVVQAHFRHLSYLPGSLRGGLEFGPHRLVHHHVIDLLKEQHRRATAIRDGLEQMIPMFPHRDEPPHTQDLLALWSGGVAATASWTEKLIQRLEAGEYVMAGDPEGMGQRPGPIDRSPTACRRREP